MSKSINLNLLIIGNECCIACKAKIDNLNESE